jgi:ribonuclease VapC
VILDSSALVAILRNEPEAAAYVGAIERAERVALSAVTYLEASIVMTPDLHPELDGLVEGAQAEIVPFDGVQALAARLAHTRFGRRSGSAARLNFGDCAAYALATTRDEPLLFKGRGFTHTDVRPALPPG